jgi:hypothetical protein
MKLKVFLLAIAAMLVVATGAAAKNGGGNGNGHAQTKHSAPGQMKHQSESPGAVHSSHGSKHGATSHEAHAPKVKKPKKAKSPKTPEATAPAEVSGVEPAPVLASGGDGTSAEAKNPAWTCKALLEERGAEQFASDYGTNPNGANAFGKCVSSVARGEESTTAEVPAPTESGDQCVPLPPVTAPLPPATVDPTQAAPADEGDNSDVPEVPDCEADVTIPPAPPAADDASSTGDTADDGSSTGDTTGADTGVVVSDPAVTTADEALLAAARAVMALAASL